MDHFFTALYQRMFTVLNAQFRFDDKWVPSPQSFSDHFWTLEFLVVCVCLFVY
jgi:hypothetical protein